MKNLNTKNIIVISLFIALQVILGRIFSIRTEFITIGFSFIPLALCGTIYGGLIGGIAGAISDIIGAILFPIGSYFPGYTLTAFLTGYTYGFFIHKKPISIKNICIAVIISELFFSLILNTYWMSLFSGNVILKVLPIRFIKTVIMIFVKIISIYTINKIFLFKILNVDLNFNNKYFIGKK